METKSWMMLRILLNRFHPKSQDAIYKTLPKESLKNIQSQEVLSDDVSLLLQQPYELLPKIHYSWFVQPFEKIPKSLTSSLLAALPPAQGQGLSKLVGQPVPDLTLSDSIKRFLLNSLYAHFETQEILPAQFLPETSFSKLLTFDKNKLVEIIDFLGIYDLAAELRHIVEKKLLTKIYACPTIKQQKFLRQCLHQKEKITAPRLELDQWNGDCKKLETMLHKRGIYRLGKALSGQHPDLVWHIVHILDSGRGKAVLEHYSKEPIAGVSEVLALQVTQVINFLNKEE